MKKGLILLMSLCLLCTATKAFADDDYDDDDDHHYYRGHYSRYYDDDDYEYWKKHDDYDEWKEKRYKHWYKRCAKYGGLECTFVNWRYHSDWDDDDWDEHWGYRNHHRYYGHNYPNYRRKHVIRNVVNNLLWW